MEYLTAEVLELAGQSALSTHRLKETAFLLLPG